MHDATPAAAQPAPAQSAAAVGEPGWSARTLAVVALCFAINMVDGLDVTIVSFLAPALQREWGIGAGAMGGVFSAGLVGMALGGMALAPRADRHGRRPVILLALALMAGGMLASSTARGPWGFAAARGVVGCGIGAVLAAMAALVAEQAPARHARVAVGLVQAGYPLAGAFTGWLVALWLPHAGWRVLLAGAAAAGAVLWPLAWTLPTEPAASRGGRATGRPGVGGLFAAPLRTRTLALWGAAFCALMVLYFVVSWIPKLATPPGAAEGHGLVAGALYNFGAFSGTCAMSLLAGRMALGRLVPTLLAGAAIVMAVLGGMGLAPGANLGLALLLGILLQGGYNGLWPLAATAYPAYIRATGVGWAIGVGRGGAILGPLLGGWLMAQAVQRPVLFGVFCLPLLACAGCAAVASRAAEA